MTSQPPAVGTAAYEVEVTRSVTANTILCRSIPSHEVNTTQRCAWRDRDSCVRLCDDRIKAGAETACRGFGAVCIERTSRFTGIEAFSNVSWAAPCRMFAALPGTRYDT